MNAPKHGLVEVGFIVLGWLAVLGLLASLGGGLHWSLELFSHFTLHILVTLVVAATALAIRRRPAWAALYAVGTLLALTRAWPAFMPSANGEPVLSVTTYNGLASNSEPKRALASVLSDDADLVLVIEASEQWREALESAPAPYELVVHVPQGVFGIALLSKLPVKEARTIRLGEVAIPAIEATVTAGGRELSFVGVHLPPPINDVMSREQDVMLDQLLRWVKSHSGPVVLAGDFNSTQWGTRLRRFIEASRLSISSGLRSTWPRRLGPAGIRIDHVLAGNGVATAGASIGDHAGSDHAPVTVQIVASD